MSTDHAARPQKTSTTLFTAILLMLLLALALASPASSLARGRVPQRMASNGTSFEIRSDGTLWAWGRNDSGQLGDETTIDRAAPEQIGTATNWVSVSPGEHTVAIRSDGTLWAWGGNGSGQLGDGTTTDRHEPVQVESDTNWVSATTGYLCTAAIKSNGTLWTWGDNSVGVLGDGRAESATSTPQQVGSDTHWVSVSANSHTMVAIKSDGTLWARGYNGEGQIGDGSPNERDTPWQIGSDTDWVSAVIGGHNTAAIKSDGTLWVWGDNYWGQIGDGDTTSTPCRSPSRVGSAKDWSAVSVRDTSVYAIKTDGTLWAWGDDSFGQLGDGTPTATPCTSPEQIGAGAFWASVAAGNKSAFAVKSDGTIWAWGDNTHGQIGDGTQSQHASPEQIGLGWSSVSTGAFHTVAVRSDGSLWAWGYDYSGQLGDGATSTVTAAKRIGTATNWASVSAGMYHTAAIRSDGTLWAWGDDMYGELGDGAATTTPRTTPERIGTASDWVAVSAGDYHTVALKSDGTLWAWGDNGSGQLGDGGAELQQDSPKQIGTGTHWAAVSSGAAHTLALRANGTLWAWGENGCNELGDGTTTNASAPEQIGSDTHWASASAGAGHSVAMKSDGTLWAWGADDHGQLGDGGTTNASTPEHILPGTTDWVSAVAGLSHSMGVKSDGTLWAWGADDRGQLGDGGSTDVGTPQQVGSATNWLLAQAGAADSAGLRSDGTLWTWGLNSTGELGDGTTGQRTAPYAVPGATLLGARAAQATISANDRAVANCIKPDGTLWAWGGNGTYGMGNGTTINRAAPAQVTTIPLLASVASGSSHTLAVGSDGTLWAWGLNGHGELGDGSTSDRSRPVGTETDTHTASVAPGYMASAAIKSDGTLWTWGDNGYGQLGNNSPGVTDVSTPSQITTATDWVSVTSYYRSVLAIKSDGTLWAWGWRGAGQLGDGSHGLQSWAPEQITTDRDWKSESSGWFHTAALKSDGTLWAWGSDSVGQLGDGNVTSITCDVPKQIGGDDDWVTVAAGEYDTAAIKSDGTLWVWGDYASGLLGDGAATTTVRPTPGRVGSDHDWVSVSLGRYGVVAEKSDGTVWTWGRNQNGELGDGTTTPNYWPHAAFAPGDCLPPAVLPVLSATHPVLSGRSTLAAVASAVDAGSVVTSMSWSVDTSAGAAADTIAEASTRTVSISATGLADGIHYLHVRARDFGLNWGPTLTRAFDVVFPVLTYGATPGGSVEGSTTQVLAYGADGSSVTATASTGYRFGGWSDGVSTATRQDTSVTEDTSVSALFSLISAPVAVDDMASVPAGTGLLGFNVLANDSQADGDLFTAEVTTAPSHATTYSLDPMTGILTYFPDPAFVGTDTLVYRDYDATTHLYSGPATVTISVVGTAPTGFTTPQGFVSSGGSANVTYTAGVPSSFTAATSGVPTPTVTIAGTPLPSGLTSSTTGASATFSGTAASGGQSADATLTATNGAGSATLRVHVITVAACDVSVTKAASVATASPSDVVTYTITLRNAGPTPTPDTTVTDTFDSAHASVLTSAGGTVAANTITWHVAPADWSGTATKTVVFTMRVAPIPSFSAGHTSVADTVTIAGLGDTNPTNDTATASVGVDIFRVHYALNPPAAGWFSGGAVTQLVAYGASSTAVTAHAATDYDFVSWSDGSTATTRHESNVTHDTTLTASFKHQTFTMCYLAGSGGSLEGSATQVVDTGSYTTTVTAKPDRGHHFLRWSDGDLGAERRDSYSYVAVGSVTASFPVNSAPVAVDDTASVPVGTGLPDFNVLTNDSQADHDSFTATVTAEPSHATAYSLDPMTGILTYFPDPSFVGTDTLAYRDYDADTGLYSNTATVTISVVGTAPAGFTTPQGFVPSGGSANVTYTAGVPSSFTAATSGVPTPTVAISGDPLPSGLTSSTSGTSATFSGTAASGGLSADATLTATNGAGSATLRVHVVTVADSDVSVTKTASVATASPSDVVTYTVTLANHGPSPTPDTTVTDTFDSAHASVLDSAGGTVSGGNTITWHVAPADWSGATSTTIVYTMRFGQATSFAHHHTSVVNTVSVSALGDTDPANDTATATVDVASNRAPAAVDDTAVTHAGEATGVPSVLANDSDPEGDSLVATLVAGPAHAAAFALAPDGTYTYTPDPSFAGTDTFRYRDSDGALYSSPATVSISVIGTAPEHFVLPSGDTAPVGGSALVTLTAGVHASFAFSASGVPTPTLSWSGDPLPAGLTATVTAGGATIAGTPAFGAPGVYDLVLTATNDAGSGVLHVSVVVGEYHTITPSASANGTITPSAPQVVSYGQDSPLFTITPDSGFHVSDVKIDGVSIGATDSAIFHEVVADHTISATFSATKPVFRIGEGNRYQTSVRVGSTMYPSWGGVKHLILASGDYAHQPDSLTGAGLAKAYDGPLLLVPKSWLDSDIKAAILAMPKGLQVHVLGGPTAVSDKVLASVRKLKNVKSVDRIAGSDRFGTAAAIATRMKVVLGRRFPSTAMITGGRDAFMFDPLLASTVSASENFPVLLVKPDSLPSQTRNALASLGLKKRYIVGTTAAVGEKVRTALGVQPGDRICGTDIYTDSVAFAARAEAEGWLKGATVGFAATLPDTASSGSFMGSRKAPLLIVHASTVPTEVASQVASDCAGIECGYAFGGVTALSEPNRLKLQDLINGKP